LESFRDDGYGRTGSGRARTSLRVRAIPHRQTSLRSRTAIVVTLRRAFGFHVPARLR
jgi:hypothetical protein